MRRPDDGIVQRDEDSVFAFGERDQPLDRGAVIRFGSADLRHDAVGEKLVQVHFIAGDDDGTERSVNDDGLTAYGVTTQIHRPQAGKDLGIVFETNFATLLSSHEEIGERIVHVAVPLAVFAFGQVVFPTNRGNVQQGIGKILGGTSVLRVVHAVVIGMQVREDDVVDAGGCELHCTELIKHISVRLDNVVGVPFLGGQSRPQIAEEAMSAEHAIAIVDRLRPKVDQGRFTVRSLDQKRINYKRRPLLSRVASTKHVVLADLADAGVEQSEFANRFLPMPNSRHADVGRTTAGWLDLIGRRRGHAGCWHDHDHKFNDVSLELHKFFASPGPSFVFAMTVNVFDEFLPNEPSP